MIGVPFLHVLVALAAVILTARLLGIALRPFGQPPVIAEVLAGILLGPSVFGALWPGLSAQVMPASLAPSLNVLAQLGVVLYMFLVGLEIDLHALRARARSTVAVASAGMVAPFFLGALLALFLYPRLATPDVPILTFALFMAVAISITAFPVLARILKDRGITHTPLGIDALTCAAVTDVIAWGLLAFVVAVARPNAPDPRLVVALTIVFILVLFGGVGPVIRRMLARRSTGGDQDGVWLALTGLLLSAAATELIGVHAIFGAFLFGLIIPHDSALAHRLTDRFSYLVTHLLLPAFFASTGLHTRIGLVSGLTGWLICGLIIVIATAGKFGGTFAAARLGGMSWRHAAGLGILMNTRGLMELIVLNVGLELGVISPGLFTMLVIMAVVTTITTTPLLDLVHPRSRLVGYNRPALRTVP